MKCTNNQLIEFFKRIKKDHIYVFEISDLRGSYRHSPLKIIECGIGENESDFYILSVDKYSNDYCLNVRSQGLLFAYNVFDHLTKEYNILSPQVGLMVTTDNNLLFEDDNLNLREKCKRNIDICTGKVLLYDSKTKPFFDLKSNIEYKKLLFDDVELVNLYMESCEEQNDGNTLQYYFETCVLYSDIEYGDVHVMIKNDIVIGYIACTNYYDNIWDVMYVYVNEQERNNSYGSMLINYYANYISNYNGVPYYSNPNGIASEKSANKAGFNLVCTTYTK